MRRIFICSPYRGDVRRNIDFALALCRRATMRGFRPVAPHLLYTRFLDDGIPAERKLGLALGLADLAECSELWWSLPRGMTECSQGMQMEFQAARKAGIPVKKVRV